MLTVVTYSRNIPATANIIRDFKSITYNTNAQGGFIDANIELFREPGRFYNDIGINYLLKIFTDDGSCVWEGKIANIPQPINGNSYSYTLTCTGFSEILSYITSVWKPNYAAATDIGSIVRDGLAVVNTTYTLLNYSTITVPNTGRSIVYQPNSYGSLLSHTTEILKYGDSNNNILTYQVWNDRTFYLVPRPSLLTPDYEINLVNCDSANIGVNSDNFYTQVTVRYRSAFDEAYVKVKLGDAAVSSLIDYSTIYGSVYGSANPAAVLIPYIREPEIIDITSHGVITAAQAQNVAVSLLTAYAGNGIRLSSSSITVKDYDAVTYASSGIPVDLAKVRAGETISIKDLSGTDLNQNQSQSSMYITQTSVTYDENGLVIQLSGESQPSTDVMLGAMLSSIPVIPLSGDL